MPQDASTVIGGPCIITHNGATFYSEDGVKIKVMKDLKRRAVSGFGSIPAKLIDEKVEITFRPSQYKNTGIMIPYLATAIGTRIFGNTDLPVVIQSVTEALKYTFTRGAVTKAPNLGLGVKKDLLGEMTITCLKANAAELSGASSVVALTDPSAFADASFDVTKLFDVTYTAAWGAGAYAAMETEDGIDVEFEYELTPVMMSGAIIDMRLQDVKAKASFIPANLTHANLLALMSLQGVARGTALSPTNANNLVITGAVTGAPLITLIKAYVTDTGVRADTKDHFADKFTFEAARTFTSGVAQAIATVSAV